MSSPFPSLPPRTRPGLFITGTDTGVGKTLITCAIAASLRRAGMEVGVCKPMATGCRREREGLVSEDAEALAHFAQCRQPLSVINPITFAPPLAPAVAAEMAGVDPDFALLARSVALLDASSDCVLVEGVGGVMVPIDPRRPRVTVLEMIRWMGYPAVVVARAGLGTLNHTAMTVRLLRESGCRVAGIVINGYEADAAMASDPAMAGNRVWLERMNGVSVLATVPRVAGGDSAEAVAPEKGRIPEAILDAVGMAYWADVASLPTAGG